MIFQSSFKVLPAKIQDKASLLSEKRFVMLRRRVEYGRIPLSVMLRSGSRKHVKVTFHLSQCLSYHKCFNVYLHCLRKMSSDEYTQCEIHPDDAKHPVVIYCDTWHNW